MRIADVIYNQVALKKNRLLYGGIMKKSCDNCKFEEYSWKEQVCVSCERHGMVQYKDNWQPKPSDKDQPENIDINCPHCGVEFVTAAEGNTIIKCPACEKALGKKEKPKSDTSDLEQKIAIEECKECSRITRKVLIEWIEKNKTKESINNCNDLLTRTEIDYDKLLAYLNDQEGKK